MAKRVIITTEEVIALLRGGLAHQALKELGSLNPGTMVDGDLCSRLIRTRHKLDPIPLPSRLTIEEIAERFSSKPQNS